MVSLFDSAIHNTVIGEYILYCFSLWIYGQWYMYALLMQNQSEIDSPQGATRHFLINMSDTDKNISKIIELRPP